VKPRGAGPAATRCWRCSISHKPVCPDDRRWPIEPVVERVGARIIYAKFSSSSRNIFTYGFTDRQADLVAVALGLHPCVLWPDWFAAGLTAVDAQRSSGGWRNAFIHLEKIRGNDV